MSPASAIAPPSHGPRSRSTLARRIAANLHAEGRRTTGRSASRSVFPSPSLSRRRGDSPAAGPTFRRKASVRCRRRRAAQGDPSRMTSPRRRVRRAFSLLTALSTNHLRLRPALAEYPSRSARTVRSESIRLPRNSARGSRGVRPPGPPVARARRGPKGEAEPAPGASKRHSDDSDKRSLRSSGPRFVRRSRVPRRDDVPSGYNPLTGTFRNVFPLSSASGILPPRMFTCSDGTISRGMPSLLSRSVRMRTKSSRDVPAPK